jgi:LacI family transcriptional regulator
VNVAKKAGVSVMTASRALAGSGYVSKATLEKVHAAAAELGYVPNLQARSMKGGKTNVIGVMLSHFQSAVVNELAGAVSEQVRKAGMDMIIYDSVVMSSSRQSEGVQAMLRGMCDGLIFIMPRVSDAYLRTLEQGDAPAVLINYRRSATTLPNICGDNQQGSAKAVQYLLDIGHRRIAFVRGTAHSGQSADREQGYLTALAAAGIEPDGDLLVEGDYSRESGNAAARRLLALPRRPTAICTANDEMAFGVIDEVQRRGLSVPKDISVVGFDDISSARSMHPALTTIRQPLTRLAEVAVRELMARIQGKGTDSDATLVEFPSEFIVRESTAPPPATAA